MYVAVILANHVNPFLQHEVSIFNVTFKVNIIQRGEAPEQQIRRGSHYPRFTDSQLQSTIKD